MNRFSENGTPVIGVNAIPMIELQTRSCQIRFPVKENLGWVIDQVENQGVGIIDPEAKPEFKLIVPRIPFPIILQVLDLFYREANLIQKELEVWITLEKGVWDIYIPEQVNRATRIFDIESFSAEKSIVAIIHSHGIFPAIVSNVDNKFEIYGFVYGVVGSLFTGKPEIKFRFGWNKEYMPLEVNDVIAIT